MITIYHNPMCSKSREALGLLEQYKKTHHVDIEIILYLENPPSALEIENICHKLGITPKKLARTSEPGYKLLGNINNNEWSMVLAAQPELIQRPIVVTETKAAIGRPPENILEILETY